MTPPSRQATALRQLTIVAALTLLVAMLAFATARHAQQWEEQAKAETSQAAMTPSVAQPASPAASTATERERRRPIGPGLRPSPDKLLPVDHSSFGRAAKPPADPPPVEAPAPVLEDTTPRPTLLPRPVVINGGSLRVGSGTVRLPGIEPPTETCGGSASLWPCGARARTALRALVRSRSITCTVPGKFQTTDETVESACTLGTTDIGQWLVANGWAKAAAGGPYAAEETEARAARAGIWAERDPSASEGIRAPDVPPAPPQ